MDIDITLKNYRCFSEEHPARFSLHKGFLSFIGVNNSGKSTLLKFFYEFRQLFGILANPQPALIDALLRQSGSSNFPPSVYDRSQLFNNENNKDIIVEFDWGEKVFPPREDNLPYCSKVKLTLHRSNCNFSLELWSGQHHYDTHNAAGANWRDSVLELNDTVVVDCKPMFELFGILNRVVYIGPFRNAINVGTKEDYFDIQIGQSFIQSWQSYQAGSSAESSQMIYNLSQDIRRIFGFKELQIFASSDTQTLNFTIDGRSYKLSELGSGIAQFVLVLANALIRKPTYILIDEPELNLHPSLQIDFLTTLSSYAQYGTLFATHNIGLARAVSEHTYSIRRDDHNVRTVSKLEELPSLSEFLGELSFAGYRDLGYDKILLVEGSTEVKTFHQLLRKYQKDHKVIVMPLGGNDLIKSDSEIELQEILRITEHVYAVVDSERGSANASLSKDRQAFFDLCKRLKINCKVLDRRATENYFSDQAVKKIKGEKYSALTDYESLKKRAQFGWSKAENWKIANVMSRDEIDGTDLGEFLQNL